jgi:hypothetical protein
LRLEVRCFNQFEDLHPVAGLQGVTTKIFDEFDDAASLFDLSLNFAANTSALSLDKFVLRQFLFDVFFYFVDRFDNHLSIQMTEWLIIAHLSSLLPVKQNLP